MIDKPRVLVSRCLGFSPCRYDGQIVNVPFVKSLESYVDFIKLCPEVEIGLGIPRPSIRLVKKNGVCELYQPKTDKIVTKEMEEYSCKTLEGIEVEGAILKGRSPTCGIKDVKVYYSFEKGPSSSKGIGKFAEKVYDYFPYAAVEEEGRLTNLSIREHFLIKLFTNMRFKNSKELGIKGLIDFHTKHKYLFMMYNQEKLKVLGNIIANQDKIPLEDVFSKYEENLILLLDEPIEKSRAINSLMHIFGYFSDDLKKEEKDFILDSFYKLREDQLHLGTLIHLMKGYVIRSGKDYLSDQYLWEPFPEELLDIRDSGNK